MFGISNFSINTCWIGLVESAVEIAAAIYEALALAAAVAASAVSGTLKLIYLFIREKAKTILEI